MPIANDSHTQLLRLLLSRSISAYIPGNEDLFTTKYTYATSHYGNGNVASFSGTFMVRGRPLLNHSLFLKSDGNTNIGMLLLPRNSRPYDDSQVIQSFLAIVNYMIDSGLLHESLDRYVEHIIQRSTEGLPREIRTNRVKQFFDVLEESRAHLASAAAGAAEAGRKAVAPYAKFWATLLEAK